MIGIMAVLVYSLTPVFAPAPVFAGGNLGDLQIVRTEIHSPRTDASLQLITNHGITFQAAQDRDIALVTSGMCTFVVVVLSRALHTCILTGSGCVPVYIQGRG